MTPSCSANDLFDTGTDLDRDVTVGTVQVACQCPSQCNLNGLVPEMSLSVSTETRDLGGHCLAAPAPDTGSESLAVCVRLPNLTQAQCAAGGEPPGTVARRVPDDGEAATPPTSNFNVALMEETIPVALQP